MILEENHIELDTVKYMKSLNLEVYKDLVIQIGYIMKLNADKMSIEDMGQLKLAQAIVCQLGLAHELEIRKQVINEFKKEEDNGI